MNNDKKICIFTATYPGFKGDNRGIFIEQMVLRLHEKGLSCYVVCPKIFDHEHGYETRNSIKIYRFSFLSANKLLSSYTRIPVFRMISYLLSGFIKLIYVVKVNRCKVIHAHWVIPTGFIAVVAGKILRLPVILSTHGSDMFFWAKKRLLRPLVKFSLYGAKTIVVNSSVMKEEVFRWGINGEKINEIYLTGIDIEKFNPKIDSQPIRKRYNLKEESPLLLYVGNLVELKKVDDLIRAFSLLRNNFADLKLLIVGEGEMKPALKRLVSELKIKDEIEFVGRVLNEELPNYYTAADIFVLPSRQEGLGIVLLEAMASGTAIVASNTGGIPTLINDRKTGLLFEPNNFSELASKMGELLENRGLRKKLCEAARYCAETEFSHQIQLKKLLRVYNEHFKK